MHSIYIDNNEAKVSVMQKQDSSVLEFLEDLLGKGGLEIASLIEKRRQLTRK